MTIPRPRLLAPESVPSLRWGVVGPGAIAETFVSALHQFTSQRVTAVASTRPERARDFALRHAIGTSHSNYDQLMDDPEVDVIYIATHIKDHLSHATRAVQAGKHVLVEKPLSYSSEDAREFFALSTRLGVFATEAMWTRYLPLSDVLRQLLDSEDIGEPELFTSQFANDNRHIPRLWTPGSGGIIFDMGIYPIAFSHFVMGSPSTIEAHGVVNDEGMDEESYVTLGYQNGARSHLLVSGTAALPVFASLSTSRALIAIDHPFFVPTGLTVANKDLYFSGEHWADTSPIQGHDGLSYQANYVSQFISEGRTESPLHPHEEIVDNLRVAEEICDLIGASPSGVRGEG